MSGRSSSSARASVTGAQINPDVCLTKNAIFSGVTCSAAMMRSPSFSRSSSSTTMTISPRPTAATAFSISANGMSAPLGLSLHQTLDVFCNHVDLQVDPVADGTTTQGRDLHGVRDHRHAELVVGGGNDGEAAPVDGDRALLHDVPAQRRRDPDPEVRRASHDHAHAVHVALHHVSAQ